VLYPLPGKIVLRAGVTVSWPVPLVSGDLLEFAGPGGPSVLVYFHDPNRPRETPRRCPCGLLLRCSRRPRSTTARPRRRRRPDRLFSPVPSPVAAPPPRPPQPPGATQPPHAAGEPLPEWDVALDEFSGS